MVFKVGEKTMQSHVLFTAAQIQDRIQALANQINKDYGTENKVTILLVLHGALLFTADLVRHLHMPTEIISVQLKSYAGTQSTGKIDVIGSLPQKLTGRKVLIVEDIVDSGRTMKFLISQLKELGAAEIKLATLLDKPTAHTENIQPEYVGFSIGPNFVIGYGLDLDGLYRNLPDILELTD